MKLNCYIYYIFPATLDTKTGEISAKDNHIVWKLFKWFFDIIGLFVAFMCDLKGIEPGFLVKIPKKEVEKISQKDRDRLGMFKI